MKTWHVGASMFLACALASSALAQSVNLTLPADGATIDDATPAATGTADAAPSAAETAKQAEPASPYPSAFHYDDPNPRNHAAAAQQCDDAVYNEPQVHGSVGVGVVGGNHVSGNYQTGVVNVTRNLGSCDEPTGVVSVSIGVSKGEFNGRRHWRH